MSELLYFLLRSLLFPHVNDYTKSMPGINYEQIFKSLKTDNYKMALRI